MRETLRVMFVPGMELFLKSGDISVFSHVQETCQTEGRDLVKR